MARCDDSRFDEFGEVAHCWIDAVLHRCARQVEAAEKETDRLVREQPPRLEPDVDDAGVRTSSEHRRSLTPHGRGKETFVVDLRVGDDLIAAPGVVSG